MNHEICRTPTKFILSQTQSSKLANFSSENSGDSNSNGSIGTPRCKYSLGQRNYMTPTNHMFNKRAGTFSLLPVVNTPPRFPRVINPFDAAIADRLHLPMIHSPLFCNSFGTPRTNSTVADKFEWTIDEIASLSTVNVEPCETQFNQTPDPDSDAKAQSAISLFFQQTDIAPSPIESDSLKTHKMKLTELMMTNEEYSRFSRNNSIVNPVSKKTRRDGSSQTVLTLPPILPKNIDQLLQEYFTYDDDQQQHANDSEDSNSDCDKRDSLLRRKLFDNSNISMKSCDTDHDGHLSSGHNTQLSPPPQSPDLIVARLQSPNRRSISARFNDITSDESETKIVIPNGNTSFDAISPIATRSPPLRARRLVKRCGSDSSIDIYQSTPDRLTTYQSTSLMEIGAAEGSFSLNYENRKIEYLNQTVDDLMQISNTSSMNNSGEHPSTPLRSRNRSANRKNLSRSFILFHELAEQDDQLTTEPPIEIEECQLQRIDSGYDDKNIYLNDVSMKSDLNAYLLSSTPSKVVG